VSAFERDGSEVEALLTDLYLESVLARTGTDFGPADARLDPALRAVSDRLRRDLIRVHPSFRFEERLAARLAQVAAGMRIPAAVGGEGKVVVPFGRPGRSDATEWTGVPTDGFDPLAYDDAGDDDRREIPRPLLIGGALTSAAISLAGAAFVAWRRTRPSRSHAAMARAARAVRQARLAAHAGRLD
jgi:hypothetical protein